MPENRSFIERIRGNAEWAAVSAFGQWLWSLLVPIAYWVFQHLRHAKVDWIGLAVLFVLTVIALLLSSRRAKPPGDDLAEVLARNNPGNDEQIRARNAQYAAERYRECEQEKQALADKLKVAQSNLAELENERTIWTEEKRDYANRCLDYRADLARCAEETTDLQQQLEVCREKARELPSLPSKEEQSVRLALSIEPLRISYHLEHSAWHENRFSVTHGAKEALIAWFENPILPRGTPGVDTSGLCAHVRYSVSGHWTTQVARAYWLDHSANEVTIAVASRAGLILGFIEGSEWVSHSNPHESRASDEFIQPAMWPLGPKVQMPAAAMDIEISLLLQGSITVDQQQVRLEFPSGQPFAVRIP